MQSTSRVQTEAHARREPSAVEQVREGIWTFSNPVPARVGTVYATLGYLIEDADGGVHVVDPGLDHDPGVAALEEGLAAAGRTVDDLASIVVTHLHPDHLGMAASLRERTGAPVIIHEREREVMRLSAAKATPERLESWGVPQERRADFAALRVAPEHLAIEPDLTVADGAALPIPGRSARVLHTPGHTAGSLCVVLADDELILTGDTVLPDQRPGLGLSAGQDSPILDYLVSMRRLAEYDAYEVGPGHEFRFHGLAERVTEISEHHLRRARDIAAAREASPDASVWDIASGLVWSGGFANLSSFMLVSALNQTASHLAFLASPEAAEFL